MITFVQQQGAPVFDDQQTAIGILAAFGENLTTWYVHYFGEGESASRGGAIVVESESESVLFFVFVEEAHRGSEVARAIVSACRAKWPGILFTKRIGKEQSR